MKQDSKKKGNTKPRVMPVALAALASVIVTVIFMSIAMSGSSGHRQANADVKIFLQPDGHLMRAVTVPGSVVPAVKDDPECPKCRANQIAICKQAFVEVLDSMRIGVD